MAKIKIHPHDALIHKLDECLDDLEALDKKYNIDTDQYNAAYDSIDSAIDDVRQIDI